MHAETTGCNVPVAGLLIARLVSAGLCLYLNGCATKANDSKVQAEPSATVTENTTVLPTNEGFIAIGGPGLSKTFGSLVTIYQHRSDEQPGCQSCFRLRVVLDDRTRPIVGTNAPLPTTALAHSAAWKFSDGCAGMTPPVRSPFSAIWPSVWSPRELQLSVRIEEGKCPTGKMKLEIYMDRCNEAEPKCNDAVVKYNFEVPLKAIAALRPWMSPRHPNLAEPSEFLK